MRSPGCRCKTRKSAARREIDHALQAIAVPHALASEQLISGFVADASGEMSGMVQSWVARLAGPKGTVSGVTHTLRITSGRATRRTGASG